jgi:predicted Zn-dependent protease with MMP-like domain
MPPMTHSLRRRFDEILDQIIEELPDHLYQLLDEVPLIVEDRPSPELLRDMDMDEGSLLCGLHWGVPLTERSVEHSATLPDQMRLFREPIIAVSRYKRGGSLRDLIEQVRITLLHEIGHHFGLDEDDLEALGYG